MQAWQQAHSVPKGIPDYDGRQLTVVAALLVNRDESTPEQGLIRLGGRSSDKVIHLRGTAGTFSDLPTSIWGSYNRTTWCYSKDDALLEAIASNSRGPVAKISKGADTAWLFVYLDIPADKFFPLMHKGWITAQAERNGIHAISIHADIPAQLITRVDLDYYWAMECKVWAHIKLGKWQFNANAFCNLCSKPGPTWQAYCADCWAKHMAGDGVTEDAPTVVDLAEDMHS